jgi:hypothetical protein
MWNKTAGDEKINEILKTLPKPVIKRHIILKNGKLIT